MEYRIEGIRIFNVDEDDAGQVIRDAAGNYTKSVLTGGLIWDTRDSLFLTRRGEVVEFTAFIAGGALGGNVRGLWPFPRKRKVYPLALRHHFDSVKGEIAVVDSYGGSDDVPIFDRLYLGGSNNLRGFDYREVGPVDEFNNPIGGSSLGYVTFEITIPDHFARSRGDLQRLRLC